MEEHMKGFGLVCSARRAGCQVASQTQPPSARAGLRALVFAAALAGLVGCAHPSVVSTAPAATAIVVPPPTDSVGAAPPAEPPTVQVRDYPYSPTVSIVAWAPEETAYGLRASVRRDGSLVRDHQLYVSASYLGAPGSRGVVQTVAPSGRLLELTGRSHDEHSCYGGGSCSPYETFGMRVPDALLRASRDSVAVRLYRAGAEFIITVHRDLIDPYLEAVDSVTAALRKK